MIFFKFFLFFLVCFVVSLCVHKLILFYFLIQKQKTTIVHSHDRIVRKYITHWIDFFSIFLLFSPICMNMNTPSIQHFVSSLLLYICVAQMYTRDDYRFLVVCYKIIFATITTTTKAPIVEFGARLNNRNIYRQIDKTVKWIDTSEEKFTVWFDSNISIITKDQSIRVSQSNSWKIVVFWNGFLWIASFYNHPIPWNQKKLLLYTPIIISL